MKEGRTHTFHRDSVCMCVNIYILDLISQFDNMKHALGRYGTLDKHRRKRRDDFMEKQLRFEHIL